MVRARRRAQEIALPTFSVHVGSLKLHLLRAVDIHAPRGKSLHFPGYRSRVLTCIPKNTSGSPKRSLKARQPAYYCTYLISIAIPIHVRHCTYDHTQKKGAAGYELRAWHEEIIPVLVMVSLTDGLALLWHFWMPLEFIEIM